MPDLGSSIHLDMWRDYKRRHSLGMRLRRAAKELFNPDPLYGLEWGDPEGFAPLGFVRDRYVLPYRNPEHNALEIGPGGGRWTRYLLQFHKLYVVDYHAELLNELKKNFHGPHLEFVRNSGTDFPGVPDHSINFLFSFGVFVHLDPPLIASYLENMKRIVALNANIVLQYSDQTKIFARTNPGFSDNTPERMRKMLTDAGFRTVEEDLTTLSHSSIVRFMP